MSAAYLRMFTHPPLPAARRRRRLPGIVTMLTVLGQAASAQKSPAERVAVDFSHVAISLDSATFQAMAASSFLRHEFGGLEDRPAPAGTPNASFLFYGRDTYLEFLNARPLYPLGSQQLAFVVRHTGELHAAVDALLTKRPRAVTYNLIFRQVGPDSVPLFWRARLRPAVNGVQPLQGASSPELHFDILERHAEYLRRSDPTVSKDSGGVTNVEYLSHRWRPDAYFRSVTSVTVAADSVDVAAVAGDLAALGYVVRQAADTLIATHSGFVLKFLRANASRRGVLAVRLATQRPKNGETIYRFGARSVLRFDTDSTASWTFQAGK